MKESYHLDITLYELAFAYMMKKKIEPTTGNLFWVMERICGKLDLINRGKGKNKLIEFTDGVCIFKEK